MNSVKPIFVIIVVGLMFWAFRHRRRVGIRAGARMVGLLLAVLAITSIVNPGIPQSIANHLGITRGTDLVLYLLVFVFVLTSVGLYFRCRELEDRITTLVRVGAIRDAVLTDGAPGALVPIPEVGGVALIRDEASTRPNAGG